MNIFNMLITGPLGFIIRIIYNLCNNYGVAIILFTIAVKIIMLPLGIKQQKSMAKTAKLQPHLKAIQDKYKNDKEKLNQETMKLYQENGANPLSGCLPLLIQMPILYGLYNVIYKPLTYIIGMPAEEITDKVAALVTKVSQPEIFIASTEGLINFNLLGIDLSSSPSLSQFSALWIIPVLATLATYFSSKLTRMMQPKQPGANEQAGQMAATMEIAMPAMTLMFTFSMPAGVGLYWFISSATQVLQQYALTKLIKDDSDVILSKQKKGGGKRK